MGILHVVGARPNFIKTAAVMRAFSARGQRQWLLHTGQHYDFNMSSIFFQQLKLPAPDVNLAVGSGTHAQQTAEVMLRIEPALNDYKPDMVMVYGDVNSTLAAALVCSKLHIPVAHVEAGLRSGDRTMPEEINRILTDQISDFLFTPSADADANLRREGIEEEKIHPVGNVMIDTLARMLPEIESLTLSGLPEHYVLLTLHRPSNVDDLPWLSRFLKSMSLIPVPILFPVHPRTRDHIRSLMTSLPGNFVLLEPRPYLEFIALQMKAAVVITDSGGVQEETTYLNRPCLTVRESTERPITVSMGSNIVLGRDTKKLRSEIENVLNGNAKQARAIPLWDGHAAERIAEILFGRAIAASA